MRCDDLRIDTSANRLKRWWLRTLLLFLMMLLIMLLLMLCNEGGVFERGKIGRLLFYVLKRKCSNDIIYGWEFLRTGQQRREFDTLLSAYSQEKTRRSSSVSVKGGKVR